MSRTKRIFAFLLSTVILIALMPGRAEAAGTQQAVISIGVDRTEYDVGQTVTVSVKSLAAGQVTNGRAYVKFDPALLTYVHGSAKKGGAWSDSAYVVFSVNDTADKLESGVVILAWAGTKSASEGDIFTLEFTASAPGKGALSLADGTAVNANAGGYSTDAVPVIIRGSLTGEPRLSRDHLTYGETLDKIILSGSMTATDTAGNKKDVKGSFAWADPNAKPEAGTYTAHWVFTPEDADIYCPAEGDVNVTVRKATVTGAPYYLAVSEAGKTLEDTHISTENSTFSVPGRVEWADDPQTEVTLGTAYQWIFTPSDIGNYELLRGEAIVWRNSETPHEEHTHFSEWTVVTEATCTEDGMMTRLCYECGVVEEQVIAKLGHEFGPWAESLPATCTSDGVETRICSRCGAAEERTVASLGHDYLNGTCTICGESDPKFHAQSGDTPCDGGDDCPSRAFEDLALTGEGHDAMDYMIRNGLFVGVSENNMRPDAALSRAMAVTVLYRAAGSPKVSGDMPFTDVPQGSYFWEPVAWAWANGIAKGTSATTFAPDQEINTEQFVTLLHRYAGAIGLDTSPDAALEQYTGWESVHDFASQPMSWAAACGLLDLGGDGLTPQNAVDRLNTAVMFRRMLNLKEH